MVLFLFFFVSAPAQAIPTGTGADTIPLGSDAGDDLNVGSGKLVVEGDTGNVGIGTASPASKFQVEGSIGLNTTTITGNTTLDNTHNVVLANCTGNITITLPAAASNTDKTYYIKKIDNDADTVTIDGNASETIDGATTLVLYIRYDAVRIICDGSNWHVISDERQTHKAKMTRDAAQSIPNNTLTKIAFDNEVFDVGGIADATTNDRFNILRAGKYWVSAMFYMNAVDQAVLAIYIYKNGAAVSYGDTRQSHPSTSITSSITDTLDFAVNDFIEIYVHHQNGSSTDTATTDPFVPRASVIELLN